jgi:hypothetical protein
MHRTLGPFAYICECGKKWVFSTADVNTTRRCDCGRILVVQQQAVYSQGIAGALQSAAASRSGP